jgi:hypothetical protein
MQKTDKFVYPTAFRCDRKKQNLLTPEIAIKASELKNSRLLNRFIDQSIVFLITIMPIKKCLPMKP